MEVLRLDDSTGRCFAVAIFFLKRAYIVLVGIQVEDHILVVSELYSR